MMSKTQIDAPAGVPFIDITREFDAPRDLVFKAYTEPELLVQWLGPRKYTMTIDEYEPRDGGRWRYVHSRRRGQRVGLPRRLPRRPDARRHAPDLRVRGRARSRVAGEARPRGA